MNLFITLAVFAIIAAVHVPAMVKNKRWRDLIIYAVFYTGVLAIGILMAWDVVIPSPVKGLQAFYQDVLHLSFANK